MSSVACTEDSAVLSEVSENLPCTTETINALEDEASFSDEKEDENIGFVHICGAVKNPGIYRIRKGERLYEAIEEAGGFDEEADTEVVNLAKELSDAEQIRIPYIGENIQAEEDGLINLNKADVSELVTIPGIGESRANAIIEYRNINGGFKDIEELKNIPGIKDATFNKIKPYVCVK